MTTQNKQLINQKLKWSRMLSVLSMLLGTILLIYMITIEDEPGAVPLLFIGIGMVCFLVSRNLIRRQG